MRETLRDIRRYGIATARWNLRWRIGAAILPGTYKDISIR